MGKRLLIVVAIVLVLAVMASRLGLRNAARSTTIPQSIAGLQLHKAVTGQAAIAEISDLHGKDVGVTGGWVGYYDNKVVIWMAEISEEESARGLLKAMEQRIATGNRIFTDLKKIQEGNVTVFSVIGMGQRHFFYQKENKLVWIAAPIGSENEFLRQVLAVIS